MYLPAPSSHTASPPWPFFLQRQCFQLGFYDQHETPSTRPLHSNLPKKYKIKKWPLFGNRHPNWFPHAHKTAYQIRHCFAPLPLHQPPSGVWASVWLWSKKKHSYYTNILVSKRAGAYVIGTWKKPATAADPHLSLCIPAMIPPALMSAPPVSYVMPCHNIQCSYALETLLSLVSKYSNLKPTLPTTMRVCWMGPSPQYSSLITRAWWRGTAEAQT